MRLIILKATINDYVGAWWCTVIRSMKRVIHLHYYLGACWCTVIRSIKIVTCLQLQFALLLLVCHVCLTAMSIIRKGLLAPSSCYNYSTTQPSNFADRNHGSRLGVVSSCCNYSTTTPPVLIDITDLSGSNVGR